MFSDVEEDYSGENEILKEGVNVCLTAFIPAIFGFIIPKSLVLIPRAN